MRTKQELELVDLLVAQGLNDVEVARRTGIPRGTIRDWRRGRRPQHERLDRFGSATEPRIPPGAQRAYAHVLGLYLGDGHITRMPRTWRIRVFLDAAYPSIVDECGSAIEIALDRSAAL